MNPEVKKEVVSIVSSICGIMGLNTAHDFDGIESDEDIVLYLKAIKRELPRKRLIDDYVVKQTSGLY